MHLVSKLLHIPISKHHLYFFLDDTYMKLSCKTVALKRSHTQMHETSIDIFNFLNFDFSLSNEFLKLLLWRLNHHHGLILMGILKPITCKRDQHECRWIIRGFAGARVPLSTQVVSALPEAPPQNERKPLQNTLSNQYPTHIRWPNFILCSCLAMGINHPPDWAATLPLIFRKFRHGWHLDDSANLHLLLVAANTKKWLIKLLIYYLQKLGIAYVTTYLL